MVIKADDTWDAKKWKHNYWQLQFYSDQNSQGDHKDQALQNVNVQKIKTHFYWLSVPREASLIPRLCHRASLLCQASLPSCQNYFGL